ncbi:DNA polymerase theta [Plodia interpunctella]|uniref:DNA polymerase theta n=1 Tax=Plodia interpunctella TaxID=58824 RepID=UPI00236782D2|nr:DNA polymerase theta [Plodia interpunctella]
MYKQSSCCFFLIIRRKINNGRWVAVVLFYVSRRTYTFLFHCNMATSKDVVEVIDSQLLAENVGFLENCFDNSFSLQASLHLVKEYVAEEGKNTVKFKDYSQNKTKISFTQNKTIALDASVCKVTATQNTKVVNKNLKAWGLPSEIALKYEQRGINEMFDWQVNCLSNPKVLLECCNLVYSAPTSAGKTLVAEILTIKTILERQKKVIVILPFVSIVREKMFYLQDILSTSGIRVEGFMGSQSPPGGLQAVHVAVCTIEKANSLVNRLLDEGTITDLGAVIVDELHLLGDPHRGYILELLLTKIKYVSSKRDDCQIQIVGMSATLPNLEILAEWLDAELFVTDFRPIPLDEYCLVGNKYFDKNGKLVSTISKDSTTEETDYVLKICLDTIKDGCSVLIFCMTKNRCENLAQSIASSFYKLGCSGSDFGLVLRSQLKSERIHEVLEQLRNCPVGLDQILKTTISFGVAYHHAGLTFDERDIIEGAFKSGAIRVLVATSTLSSGVNLPARKVIVRSPVFQRQPINILTYKQMIGRAGRMGKDSKGESILVCTESEKKIGFDLMMGMLDPVKSCIESEDKYMRAILEMIASQVLCTKEELDYYSKCTLLFVQQHITVSQNLLLDSTLDELINYELVRIQEDGTEKRYVATPLGKACLSSSMAPNDGLSLFCELQKARQCLVLETDLHLIYLVTPYSVSSQWGDIDWLHLLTLWESLTKAMKRVGELIGVQESFIIRCLRGANKLTNVQNKMNIHKRFYTALALQDLVNEVPLSEVANKFQCARGFLQSLQQAAATFAGMVTAFCRQLGWKNMEMLIAQFQDRLHFGIHSELLELMKLPSLNGIRARTLFDAGFETVSSIASADVNMIENTLHKTVPFESNKEREGDDSDDMRKRNKIKSIWVTGCCAMTTRQAAESLITEARKYLECEIGVAEIKWEAASSNVVNAIHSNIVSNSESHTQKNKDNLSVSTTVNTVAQSNTNNMVTANKKSKIKEEIKSVKIENTEADANHSSGDTHYSTCIYNKSDNLSRNESISNRYSSPLVEKRVDISLNRIIEDEIKSSPTILPKNITVVDEIIWDSLNFTDVVVENITKLKTASNIDSPNMSFGEIEDKKEDSLNTKITTSNSKSVNDISIFSSDGDNSSLFEESLPVDLISTKLLNGDHLKTVALPKFNNENNTCTNMTNLQSDTILNAFKSTLIELEEDEDIKLVYDDENKPSDNDLEIAFNTSEEVINTQQIKETSIKNMFISPFKRQAESENNSPQPSTKKLKVDRKLELRPTDKLDITFIKLNNPKSKLFTIQLNEFSYNCYVLRDNDIYANLDILTNVKEASIYLDIKNAEINLDQVIGSNIVKVQHNLRADNAVNERKHLIKGIAVYFNDINILLDLTSSEDALIRNKLTKWLSSESLVIKVLNLRSVFIHFQRSFGITIRSRCVDISLAEWLLDSDEKIPNVLDLVKRYCNIDLSTVLLRVNRTSKKLNHLDSFEVACLRSWCIWMVAERQRDCLLKQYTAARDIFDIETQIAKILTECELQGICVDKDLASRLLLDVRNSQETLQKKAYKICGYHFNFNSSKDVAKVLGIYKGRRVSTKKSVLTSHNSPMASIVIYWRKLNSILTKTLYPLTEKACVYSTGDRVTPSYTMYTCTGRVSMHEPNLQNVPRTFSIPLTYLSLEDIRTHDVAEFNCRNVFKAAPGHVLVSADYCQLEMRILTHYSKDPVLMKIMSSDIDVFKSIAASWSNLPEEEVDDDLRQKAKQLCYGILYGMGNRTLSQHLDVTELEAAMFMDSFYKTYPAIRSFTQSVIQECRSKGYVETLSKRRRFLRDINSNVMAKKSAAERQAVNTKIQGSAADIAKAAMCAIDTKTTTDNNKPRLILQMHDELIYEVVESSKESFIKALKRVMEETVRLMVPLPVKVKTGVTWGSLEEVRF